MITRRIVSESKCMEVASATFATVEHALEDTFDLAAAGILNEDKMVVIMSKERAICAVKMDDGDLLIRWRM